MRNLQKENLMKRIDEASFAMDDAALFLDTHPQDINALNYYHYVTAMRREAMRAYEEQFGPLMIDAVRDSGRWTWGTEHWPWEREV
ncbi:MAG: spore coat protein CotJB [Otoolea sp.]|nr:spore coat protein CotJB [Clostridium sp.]MDY5484219.1 spore coat protein CotJB [Clostridium sp.]